MKHIHREGFTIDKEGTNTWRYAKAGAKVIVAISPEEIAIIKKTSDGLNDLDQIIGELQQDCLDIVFIEGFHGLIAKRTDIPKIITAVSEENLRRTLDGAAEPILAVTGVISKNKPQLNWLKVPILSLDTDGDELLGMIKKNLKEKPTDTTKNYRKTA